jgi:hypothetical protein
MPKEEPNFEIRIMEAIEDLKNATIENINASKNELNAKKEKETAYHKLIKAKERFRELEKELHES